MQNQPSHFHRRGKKDNDTTFTQHQQYKPSSSRQLGDTNVFPRSSSGPVVAPALNETHYNNQSINGDPCSSSFFVSPPSRMMHDSEEECQNSRRREPGTFTSVNNDEFRLFSIQENNIVQASTLALEQHFEGYQTSNVSECKNLYWSDSSRDDDENESSSSPSGESFHDVPSVVKKRKSTLLKDSLASDTTNERTPIVEPSVLQESTTTPPILGNDILCLAAIAAHAAELAAQEEDKSNQRQTTKKRRTDISGHMSTLGLPLSTIARSSNSNDGSKSVNSFNSTQARHPNDFVSSSEISDNDAPNTLPTADSTTRTFPSRVSSISTRTVNEPQVLMEWERMLHERPNTHDVRGMTQWLLKLYALAVPSE